MKASWIRLQRFIQISSKKVINNIYLYTLGDNKKAHKFYERNGFKKSGTWSADEYIGIKDFQSYFFANNKF